MAHEFLPEVCEWYVSIVKLLFEATNRMTSVGTRQVVSIADLEVAFERLKQAMTSAPLLSAPETGTREFMLYCDMCKFLVGALLSQLQGGVDQVIPFDIRKLKPIESCYAAYDAELLALKESMLL